MAVASLKTSAAPSALENDYLLCRTYRHAWEPFSPIDVPRPVSGWLDCTRCSRCFTERLRHVVNRVIVSRRMIYPEQNPHLDNPIPYLRKGGGRLELQSLLLETHRRQLSLQSERRRTRRRSTARSKTAARSKERVPA